MIPWFISVAFATTGFNPATPAERYEGDETWDNGHTVRLWNAIERWEDTDRTLFTTPEYSAAIDWADTDYSPFIESTFGTATPHNSRFLLHIGIHEDTAEGTPILFVPGAGDNASRGFITMATREDRLNRPIYAITFAHPHGDAFQQAEIIADAIAVIKARTGAEKVDVVAHSKGGISAVIYASNVGATDWGNATAYETVGTKYREDIRRLLLIATPLGGIDTAYRWSNNNYASTDPATALSPASWSTYYEYSTAFPLLATDLSEQDFFAEDGDLFPGQRQLLARQDHDLPGEQSWLGGYALQIDYLTTYEGGYGSYSYSKGIDAAVEAGDSLISRLQTTGVDPNIAVYLLAGTNPLMPNGDATLQDLWADVATEEEWRDLIADISEHDVPISADEDELDGLQRGALVLGEVTGVSDGLVFVESALDEGAVNHRGALVVEAKTANLSHLDLLYASPITGDLLVDAADDAEENAWMRGVGTRYTEEDTLGWVQDVLEDPDTDTDSDADTDADSDSDSDPDTDLIVDTDGEDTGEAPRPCGGCDSGTASPAWFALIAVVLGMRRRR